MGLLDLFFGGGSPSSVEVLSDRIWKTPEAKFHGVGQQIQECVDSAGFLLVAHFDDTFDQLSAIARDHPGDPPVQATFADDLSTDIAIRWRVEQTDKLDVIVAERHPLLSVDDELMKFAEELPCQCRVTYHHSLKDPLIKRFAGQWVEQILEQLGFNDDEAMESSMVSKRIRAAQKKIEASAFGNRRAASAAEWFETNMPG